MRKEEAAIECWKEEEERRTEVGNGRSAFKARTLRKYERILCTVQYVEGDKQLSRILQQRLSLQGSSLEEEEIKQ